MNIKGTDAQGKEHDQWDCSMAWAPVLTLEVANMVRQMSASIDSMRNIQTQRQDAAIDLIKQGISKSNGKTATPEIN